jgi:hypothetical protein
MRPLGILATVSGVAVAVGVLSLASPSAQGSTYYVRAGASGARNGADWTNAYAELPASLVRGATYYVADGNYGGHAFNDAGTSRITIKKATAADHGTSAGWQASYGAGQARFGRLDFEASYYTIDGNTGSLGSYGFAIASGSEVNNVDIGNFTDASVDHIEIRDVTINAQGVPGGRAIKVNKADSVLFSNVEAWNADNDLVSMEHGTNVVFEYCYFHTRNNAGVGTHADAFELWGGSNNTIRYSRINFNGQQVFWGGNFSHGRWNIYGNRFYGGPTSGKGLHSHSSNPAIGPIYVYNNTFADLNIGTTLGSNTTGEMKNNIFYDLGSNPSFGGTSHDYNWFQSGLSASGESHARFGSNPFVNAGAADFRLASAAGPGQALAAPYNVDAVGVARGTDGHWDAGAFEYRGGATTPPAPAPPLNLRIIR